MFKPHYGHCTGCGADKEDKVLIVVKKGLCKRCNYEMKQSTKKERSSNVHSSSSLRKQSKGNTGQLKLFIKLYNASNKKSEVSDDPLLPPGHNKFHWQFSHILGKGSYKDLILHEPNIMLITWQEHEEYTNGRWKDTWPEEKVIDTLRRKEELIRYSHDQKKAL